MPIFTFARSRAAVATGIAGIVVALLAVMEALTKTAAGTRPSLDDGAALVQYMTATAELTLLVVLCDTFLVAAVTVFFAGLRHLIKRRAGTRDWASDVGFGAALVWVGITLVGDSMDGGTALDVIQSNGSAVVIRTLIESHILLFGPLGGVMIALAVASFGYAGMKSRTLPRWLGYAAYISAGLNIIAIPVIFREISAVIDGVTVALYALVSFIAWILIAGVTLLISRTKPDRISD